MHSIKLKEAMVAEKITIVVNVDGEDSEPIVMPEVEKDTMYQLQMRTYYGGYVFDRDHTRAIYQASIHLSRRMTSVEEEKYGSS
jgi:hypothetical protein